MECNREEAIRAKTVAEKKFADKDFAAAKRFTLKAQTLYPELDGISQMLITLNVYISSENKINGESDWYRVFDVKPSDDDETIRKQYRKMVLMLHPDKNRSVGADGAFKILLEAWSLLSDKSKRSAYNQRRNSRGLQQRVSPQGASASSSPGVNVVNTPANRANPKQKGWNSGPVPVPPVVPAQTQAQARARGFQQNVSPQSASASSSPGVNVVNSPANRANPKQKDWNSGPVRVPPMVPAQTLSQARARARARGFQQNVSPQSASASSYPGVNVVNSPANRANPKQKDWNSGPVRVPPMVPAQTLAQARARGFPQNVSPQSASASSYPGVNVVNSPANRANPKQKGRNSGPFQVPPMVPAQTETQAQPQARGPPQVRTSSFDGSSTFWTICLKCKMHYEFYKVYLNRTVLCPNCHKPFHAVELPAPVNRYNHMDIRFSRSVHGSAGPSGASNAASFINKSKRGCEESNSQRAAKRRPNV